MDFNDDYTGGTLDMSFGLLQEAEEKLKSIVNTKFDAAVHSGDFASIERFFKIFPLIGLHEEGLTKFGKFLSSQVSKKFLLFPSMNFICLFLM
jgi:hypothetical protein